MSRRRPGASARRAWRSFAPQLPELFAASCQRRSLPAPGGPPDAPQHGPAAQPPRHVGRGGDWQLPSGGGGKVALRTHPPCAGPLAGDGWEPARAGGWKLHPAPAATPAVACPGTRAPSNRATTPPTQQQHLIHHHPEPWVAPCARSRNRDTSTPLTAETRRPPPPPTPISPPPPPAASPTEPCRRQASQQNRQAPDDDAHATAAQPARGQPVCLTLAQPPRPRGQQQRRRVESQPARRSQTVPGTDGGRRRGASTTMTSAAQRRQTSPRCRTISR